jgi:hypothetical protein
MRRFDGFLYELWTLFKIIRKILKILNPVAVYVLFCAYQWYYFYAEIIWPDGTFKKRTVLQYIARESVPVPTVLYKNDFELFI